MPAPRRLPLHAHPFEPPEPHRIAANFGPSIARGEVDREWCVTALISQAERDGYQMSLSCLRTSLQWTITGALLAWERDANRAERGIRKAVAPLFDQRATTQQIEMAAYAEHRYHGCPLGIGEIEPILADELSWWRKRLRWRRR